MLRSTCVNSLRTSLSTKDDWLQDSEGIEWKEFQDLTDSEAGHCSSTASAEAFTSEDQNQSQSLYKENRTTEHFARATIGEVSDFIGNGTFQFMDGASIAKGAPIRGSRFMDLIKNANIGPK